MLKYLMAFIAASMMWTGISFGSINTTTSWANDAAQCLRVQRQRQRFERICSSPSAKSTGACRTMIARIQSMDNYIRKHCVITPAYDYGEENSCPTTENFRGGGCGFTKSRLGVLTHAALSQDVYNDVGETNANALYGYTRIRTAEPVTRKSMECKYFRQDGSYVWIDRDPLSWDEVLPETAPPNCRFKQVETGLQMAAYRGENGDVVIAFRGTDEIVRDFDQSNLSLGSWENGWRAGFDFRQVLDAAADFTDSIIREFPSDSYSITGHSLGGAIAQVEGARTGFGSNTFSAPGVSNVTRDYLSILPDDRKGTRDPTCLNNHVRGDPNRWGGDTVPKTAGDHTGNLTIYPSADSWNPLEQHSIGRLLRDLEGGQDYETTTYTGEDAENIRARSLSRQCFPQNSNNESGGNRTNENPDNNTGGNSGLYTLPTGEGTESLPFGDGDIYTPPPKPREVLPTEGGTCSINPATGGFENPRACMPGNTPNPRFDLEEGGSRTVYDSELGFVLFESSGSVYEYGDAKFFGYETGAGGTVDIDDLFTGELEIGAQAHARAYFVEVDVAERTLISGDRYQVDIGLEQAIGVVEGGAGAEFEVSKNGVEAELEVELGAYISETTVPVNGSYILDLPFTDNMIEINAGLDSTATLGVGAVASAEAELTPSQLWLSAKLGLSIGGGLRFNPYARFEVLEPAVPIGKEEE